MADEHLLETLVDRQVIVDGEYLRFRVDTVRDAEGKDHRRETVEHPGAIGVLPLLDDDVLLVRQFRSAVGEVCLEIPAGTRDRREDGSVEPEDETAHRELAEETGYRAGRWRKLGRFYTTPGFATEEMHLYLAQDLDPIEGYAGPLTGERLDVVRIPWRDVLALADRGEIVDAKTLVGVFWLERLALRGEL